ncbi:SDR family NAD(P)-dependent oxidoreductase [Streptomyces luteireticuli]|uniref:SDR family NAD(P)-dependent oxidoreductase n=1 Tax=Streptomyces luteireticuli TaxID=173858 RepID=UPI003557E824
MTVSGDAVAVVGVGLRFPGGISSLDGLWDALAEGRDLVGEVPPDRFDVRRFCMPGEPGALRPGKSYTTAGAFLDDVTGFDAGFFGMAPREAARVDPQQRLALECAVEALDDAGIDPAHLAGGDTAVIIGVATHDFADLQQYRPRGVSPYTMSGAANCNAANRISYALDLHGASLVVDTACSSALSAVHQACEALRTGRSRLALAGGVNVLLSPNSFAGFSMAAMLSPTGRCRPFAAAADGFVRAEGAGVVVLKPLAQALADGDRVHGVLVAGGVNADGRTEGLALPSARAQAALLRQVYDRAGIAPREVAYMEAHGTGTQAGDPVECRALGEALGRHREDGGPLPVGSVKSNLGHLEAAAGMAGLFKAMLVLREGRIPATLHSEPVNEAIDFAGLGLEPVPHARPLTPMGRGVVGVNCFGFGGANAHVVVAAAPQPSVRPASTGPGGRVPLVVSARTPAALAEAAGQWADFLEAGDGSQSWYDVAYTACRRRGRREERFAVLAPDAREAAGRLRDFAAGEAVPGGARARAVERGRVGFVFCGSGASWPGMGRQLLAEDAAFRAEAEAVDAQLAPLMGFSVLEALTGPDDAHDWGTTEVAHPLLFTVQAGLVAALGARGIRPHAVCGHSVGEVAAAYAAGLLERAAACRVIAARSRVQAPTAGAGRMAAVGLGADEADGLLRDEGLADLVVVAGINGARDVTLAGDAKALQRVGEVLAARGVFVRDLGLDYAFHSPVMDGCEQPLKAALGDLETEDGRLPLVSTVTGDVAGPRSTDAGHWWRNVREPVRFSAAIDTLTGEGVDCDILVEIGPHPVLGTYLRRMTADGGLRRAVVPTMSRATAGPGALDTAQAHLLAAGARIDWDVCFPDPGRVTELPPYPWQRERHFHGEPGWWPGPEASSHPLLGGRQPTAAPLWELEVEPHRQKWLADHRIGTAVVWPATGYVDMALGAGREILDGPVELTGLVIPRAMTVPVDDLTMDVRVQTAVGEAGRITVSSRSGEGGETWIEHARGRVRRLERDRPAALDPAALATRMTGRHDGAEHYARCARFGIPYGPAFRVLTDLYTGDREALARYGSDLSGEDGHLAHPAVLDGAMQMPILFRGDAASLPEPLLPAAIATVRCWQPLPATGWMHARLHALTDHEALWDVQVTDDAGAVALELLGCRARRYTAARPTRPFSLTEAVRAAPLPGTPATPSPLPVPSAVLEACEEPAPHGRSRPDFSHRRRRLLEITAHFTAEAVGELLPSTGKFTLDHLYAAGVDRGYALLLRTLLDTAARTGPLEATGPGCWRRTREPRPRQLFREFLRDSPGDAAFAYLSGVCGRHLADVLRGTTDPLSLLFGEADPLVARVYDAAAESRVSNLAARRLLRAATCGWPGGRPLRVLEVGAGTGGLTASLLPLLPAGTAHYTFTDISPAFFPAARDRFAAFDFVRYERLDLNEDPTEQGFPPSSFDIVIAANVLHATRDVTSALRRLAGLLADGGHLLALEQHDLPLMAPIFGLLPSFWERADPALRPDGPFLDPAQWRTVMKSCGFHDIVAPSALREHGDFASVFLAARSPRTGTSGRAPAATGPGQGEGTRRWSVVGEPAAPELREVLAATVAALRAEHGEDRVRLVPAGNGAGALAGATDIVVPVDGSAVPSDGPLRLTEDAVGRLGAVRDLARALPVDDAAPRRTVWLLTRAQGPDPSLFPAAGAPAAVWGAARTWGNERSDLTIRRVALTLAGAPEEAAAVAGHLLREMRHVPADDEVFLTADGRFVPRVGPRPAPLPAQGNTADAPYALTLSNPGLRYRLAWRPAVLTPPGPGQVVLDVAAAALNYRDITTATGMTPAPYANRPSPGGECAGTVRAVGPGVTHLAPGDRVCGPVLGGGLASRTLADAHLLVPVPGHMGLAEAVTLPVAFLTVHHGLGQLARLAAGETVLVHGAAGGVGLAALQYARNIGARVIATAGSAAKRDLLHLLGVDDVLDSRSLRFADQIMDLTDGAGVDVVLNSLAGEAMIRGLDVLAPHGRFVELGMRDFLADNALPLAAFRRNLAFFGVDLTAVLTDPLRSRPCLEALRKALHSGSIRPLMHRTYPADAVHEAFDRLQHSRHTGKIVITFDGPSPLPVPSEHVAPDPEATYLITGGLGGLGAATARHLADRGARHLTLLSRRGRRAPEAPALLADLEQQGAEVTVHAMDASDERALRAVFAAVDASGRRLAGVVHAALDLRDTELPECDDELLRTVLTPKMTAGHLLDDLTRDRDLDFFVVYSSAAAMLGNVRQAPYAAANLALEAMVRERRRAGLPALAVEWGVISDTGYARRAGLVRPELGMGGMTAGEALTELDLLLARPDADVVAVGRFDFGARIRLLPTLTAPRTATLAPADSGTGTVQLRESLRHAPPEKATALLHEALTGLVAQVLQTTPERVELHRPLSQQGVDSLMASELAGRLREYLGCEISAVELTGATTPASLGTRMLTRLAVSAQRSAEAP